MPENEGEGEERQIDRNKGEEETGGVRRYVGREKSLDLFDLIKQFLAESSPP